MLLTTTKSGRELLIRTAQLALRPEGDEQESQESDVQEEIQDEPAEDVDVEEKPEEETDGDEESEVTDLKPRDQRPAAQAQEGTRVAPGRRPRLGRLATPSSTDGTKCELSRSSRRLSDQDVLTMGGIQLLA